MISGTLLAVGITGMFLFHVVVIIGMTAGIIPVTGVPLPFVSYGASSLTINLLLVGLLLNINLHGNRFTILEEPMTKRDYKRLYH